MGWGRKGTGNYYLMGIEFQFYNMKRVTEKFLWKESRLRWAWNQKIQSSPLPLTIISSRSPAYYEHWLTLCQIPHLQCEPQFSHNPLMTHSITNLPRRTLKNSQGSWIWTWLRICSAYSLAFVLKQHCSPLFTLPWSLHSLYSFSKLNKAWFRDIRMENKMIKKSKEINSK